MKKYAPLEGIIVLEFCQFLSGPSAGLRLADLGARVIKIERPGVGDACRKLALNNLFVDADSLLFHTINRNKESFTADLKNPNDLAIVLQLIKKAQVVTHNFRPGVMEKNGLGYAAVKNINPTIVYAEISGYGKEGCWKDKPGQDLLVQAVSGLAFLSGTNKQELTPFGLSIADMICGAHLVQGILAALIFVNKTKQAAHVEVSLLESILDFQFELLTTYCNGGGLPVRGTVSNAHTLLGAPYGMYKTADGYIAVAMSNLSSLAIALDVDLLSIFSETAIFTQKDAINELIAKQLLQQNNEYWLQALQQQKVWCMPVLNWQQLKNEPAYNVLAMEQEIATATGKKIKVTRGAIRFNEERLYSSKPAPALGEHTEKIVNEFIATHS